MVTPTFPLLERDKLSSIMQAAFDRSLQRRGEARLVSAMAHNPSLFKWYIDQFYGDLFYSNKALVPYLELGRLRLSESHGCRSCNKGNRLDASSHGISADKIANIDDKHHPAFSPADRAIIELADLLSLHGIGKSLDPDLYEQLKKHFSDGDILHISMIFSMLAGIAHFLFAFDFVEREDSCSF
jgi:alkylhydroperoxidase family enzyme